VLIGASEAKFISETQVVDCIRFKGGDLGWDAIYAMGGAEPPPQDGGIGSQLLSGGGKCALLRYNGGDRRLNHLSVTFYRNIGSVKEASVCGLDWTEKRLLFHRIF
jgi:hypothetical protein